ncbi:cation:proton antiporter subunit C [Thiohalocapsa marina]|uniref:Cation:proton antiporter subunit C n=1 Tax=Thiohalocapsa marina TaxID=424902 RepID=A0A5M8FMW4_9GAMM|nr:cation:proton antiporter subunit C [Thiohalocapsa marina]KAA6186069.1 cation:proton antiporter subunit C [Thiohalocapsa marina]
MPEVAHIALATGFALVLIGFYGALTQRNLLRIIVAFTLATTGVNVVIVAIGHMSGRTAPILDAAVPAAEAVSRVIDPLPQALVLTAIVIGVGITALMLAYAYRLFETRGTLDIARLTELKW